MPDARVEAAIAHRAPRFVNQGIDYNDFRTSTVLAADRMAEQLSGGSK